MPYTQTHALLRWHRPSYGILATETGIDRSVFSCPAVEQQSQTSFLSLLLLLFSSLHSSVVCLISFTPSFWPDVHQSLSSNWGFSFTQTIGMKMLRRGGSQWRGNGWTFLCWDLHLFVSRTMSAERDICETWLDFIPLVSSCPFRICPHCYEVSCDTNIWQ